MTKAKTKELYFVLWPGDDLFEGTEFDSYKEAMDAAEEYLKENEMVDGLYYVAKATDKIHYERKSEKL